MKKILRKIPLVLLAGALSSWHHPAGEEAVPYDLVICADLSASNNGILNNIRERIWVILNRMAAEHPGSRVRMGVVGYGRPSFGGDDGYVRIISPLTEDFDAMCYELFQLSPFIEKGDHFVPMALQLTLKEMRWSKDARAHKRVYLIGNGSTYTGPVNLEDVCEAYAGSGIPVSTLYITPSRGNIKNENGYRKIARITGGRFHKAENALPVSRMPFSVDEKFMVNMNNAFNSTMMFYSRDAQDRKKFSVMSDRHMLESGADAFAARLFFKSTDPYRETNAAFDLVSYYLTRHELPGRVNWDYVFREENVWDKDAIAEKVRQKAVARLRLVEEIRYLFGEIRPPVATWAPNAFEAFILQDAGSR